MDQIRIIIWIDRLTINTYDRHTRVPFRPRIREWKGRRPNLFLYPSVTLRRWKRHLDLLGSDGVFSIYRQIPALLDYDTHS